VIDSIRNLEFALAALLRPYRGRRNMEAYQLKSLQKLLRHASDRIPYYRELFKKHGTSANDIRKLDDICKLPVTGKQQLRDSLEAMLDPEFSPAQLIEHKTSGSTGVPVSIFRSPFEERRLNLLRWRMLLRQGLRPGNRLARVQTTWERLPERYDRLQQLASRFSLVEPRIFDCFRPTEELLDELISFDPHFLAGYPGALVKIGLEKSRQNRTMPHLRKVICGGESLSPHQRKLIEECFEVPLTVGYGTTECNLAAWTCSRTGRYHVCDDGILLEICRDGIPVAPGETGEIVITALHSFAMPIIRYGMGDLAVASANSCPCGSPFSTVESLQGRIIDYLQLSDGRQLHPFQVLNEIVLSGENWISEYQFEQQEPDQFLIRIVPRRSVTNDEKGDLRRALHKELGENVQLRIEVVSEIPRSASGKLHFCRFSVGQDRESVPGPGPVQDS